MSRCDRALARACWRAAAAAAAALALGGCGLLGGPAGLKQDDPQVMTVTSPAFGQEPLPAQYTCHGKGENPPVYWSGAPQGTKALALVVDDADAPITPYVYWIVYNISPDSPDIQAGLFARCAAGPEQQGHRGIRPTLPEWAASVPVYHLCSERTVAATETTQSHRGLDRHRQECHRPGAAERSCHAVTV